MGQHPIPRCWAHSHTPPPLRKHADSLETTVRWVPCLRATRGTKRMHVANTCPYLTPPSPSEAGSEASPTRGRSSTPRVLRVARKHGLV